MSMDIGRLRSDVDWILRQIGKLPLRTAGGGGGNIAEKTAEDRAGLEAMTLSEGAFCRTTGALKRAYRYLGGLLICYTHMESS